ncbi:3-oxoacyl-(acyl-carrier-protein) synthase [Paenibacillus cellulosilyticus]|uniref:3-oxoacyl-(Acyl-carrier-protein) synthase n=1 Tax=Paenibacillus cellulosilyticus TaxID=375489 RepID=A0A2V2YUH7_9BACL|nr:beta-ketoacyl synthase N-terminal-like domain-containing protein [Paenibacillus cellulosilyticus]PWW03238.1 3-oxoacyl-(acyl-carrier-protein) synthase [Paenibacillus cellulosilyticus]
MSKQSVVITGTGAISSGGIGSAAVWDSVRSQRVVHGERIYRMGDGSQRPYPVYPAPALDLRDWVPLREYEWLEEQGLHEDPDFVMLCAVASMAMDEAGWTETDKETAALVIGHENLGVNRLIDRILTSPRYADSGSPFQSSDPEGAFQEYSDPFYKLQSFPYLFYLSKALRIRGFTLAINNACATGLYGLEAGSQLIRSGKADRVVVTCADYAHLTEHLWLAGKRFGSPLGRLKPFDRDRDGSVLGDGAAAMTLESSKRTTRGMAAYAGGAFGQDTWHLTLPDVVSHTYSNVISQVLHTASTRGAKAIDLVVPHGSGNVLWDRFEAVELQRAFPQVPPITAFKGYVGHTLGANAILESVLLLHCMKDGIIPPAVGCDRPDEGLELPVVTAARESRLKRVMKTVPAYGGFMAAAMFEQI